MTALLLFGMFQKKKFSLKTRFQKDIKKNIKFREILGVLYSQKTTETHRYLNDGVN